MNGSDCGQPCATAMLLVMDVVFDQHPDNSTSSSLQVFWSLCQMSIKVAWL
ncbi:MAG: hypothetical protein H7Y02_02810 [Candidatus Obscuribacterales bacterium]|nr:hypothetical protein [Steroidobacteraceae bacterium]